MRNIGITNTLETLALIEALGVAIGREVTGDGLQLRDVFTILDSKEVRERLTSGLDGLSLIPVEVRNISFAEGFILSQRILETTGRIFESFEKKAA